MAQDFVWQDGERVMFLGDSLTEDPQGYTRLIPAMVSARYPELAIDYFQRGVGGNRVGDLLERLNRDVLDSSPAPTWISLSIGLNDVWQETTGVSQGSTGTPIGRFRELYDAVMLRLLETKATLVCLTITGLSEDLSSDANNALIPYNDTIREIAFRYRAQVVDVYTIFQDAIRRAQARHPNFRYTTDGVHLNMYGNYLMAESILQALHFSLGESAMGKAA